MKKELKISVEHARAELAEWLENMAVELPSGAENDPQVKLVVKAITQGHLVLDGDVATYTPHRPSSTYKEPLVFRERTGADMLNGSGQGMSRAYSIMASICGVEKSTFSKLSGVDIKTCEALFSLLME